MVNKKNAAFLCYLIVIISGIAVGLIYITASEPMPYHQQVIGADWTDLGPRYKLLLLTLIRGAGLGIIATSVSMGVLFFIPFRRGEKWAYWSILILGLIMLLPGLYLTLKLHLSTGVFTPWPLLLLLLILLILGSLLSAASNRNTVR